MADIRKLNTADADFQQQLDALLAWDSVSDGPVNQVVHEVIAADPARGDAALVDYTNRFDAWEAKSMAADRRSPPSAWAAWHADSRAARGAETAADRVRAYAERPEDGRLDHTEADGTVLGQQVTPLDRVGLYVPGRQGGASSSVLMNALPAKVAGVGELIMVVPTPRGELNELVLAAAHVRWRTAFCPRRRPGGGGAGLRHRISAAGRQDRRSGQHLCATAKRTVFGRSASTWSPGRRDPGDLRRHDRSDWVAMDLFSQAEHDETPVDPAVSGRRFVGRVENSIDRLLPAWRAARSSRPRCARGRPDSYAAIWTRRRPSVATSPRSTSNCRWKIRKVRCRRSGMPARSSWDVIPRSRSATYCAGPTTCADLAHRAFQFAAGVRFPAAVEPDHGLLRPAPDAGRTTPRCWRGEGWRRTRGRRNTGWRSAPIRPFPRGRTGECYPRLKLTIIRRRRHLKNHV